MRATYCMCGCCACMLVFNRESVSVLGYECINSDVCVGGYVLVFVGAGWIMASATVAPT